VYSQQVNYWTSLPKPTSHTLSRVHFTDTLQGWITGQNGVFMKTNDGGTTWSQQIPGATGEIPDLFVRTPLDVWAIEFHYPVDDTSWYGTIIHHSMDGGIQWTHQRFDSALFRTITFVDSLTGFLGGSYGMIAKTTDGGATWKSVNIGSFSEQDRWPIYKIRFQSKEFGMAVAGQLDVFGIVWKTTDGGNTWKSSKISGDPLFDVVFFDSLHILCAMGDLESSGAGFLRSLDGGITWTFENTTIWGEPSTFAFRTPSEMWVPMGTAGVCLRSTNNGVLWENIKLPQQVPVYDISFPTERTGFMVGHFGTLFKFNSAILAVQGSPDVPTTSGIVQNYPNPFNGSTVFTFSIPQRSHVIITLYDVLGRTADVVYDGIMESGDQSVRWDTADLPSGMYLYRLDDGSRSVTGKVILQR
jgi:photosystem II stability/assembly factor-like uncharacterized protein